MALLLQTLFAAGVDEKHPAYLNKKIRLSNQIAFYTLFIATGYGLFSFYFFRPLTIIPIAGIIVLMVSVLLNAAGFIYTSRVFIALVSIVLTSAYNAYICRSGDAPLTGVYLTQLGLGLTPFIVFDLREKAYLIITSAVCFFLIVSFNWSNALLEMDLNDQLLRNGPFAQVSVAMAVILTFSYVYTMTKLHLHAEEQAETLFIQMNERNTQIEASKSELQTYIDKFEENRLLESQRTWASEGLALFSTLVRQTEQFQTVADEVISQAVKYVKVNQGGFYVVKQQKGEPYIQLLSCYAYNRKKYIERRIEIGQGLIGQAYLEKEYIYLTDIPKNYITITSGLGEALPTSLLIMPLKVNEQVYGFLELASFKRFEPYQITFLEKLGEILAAVIASDQVKEHTQQLLASAQQQSQRLQAQEEEIRQNMEEMQATQEEMHRKEKDYINKITELEKRIAHQMQ